MSYLTDRREKVVIGGTQIDGAGFECIELSFGVSQGTVLESILCTLYVAPLEDTCQTHGILFQNYADNQQNCMVFIPRHE